MSNLSYDSIRNYEVQQIQQGLSAFSERLKWSPEQIKQEQQAALRRLIAYAKQHSSWHQKRLKHIDAETFTLDQLNLIPTMNKADVMANWDDIVTDKNLTLAKANDFLDHLQAEKPQYYLDKYHIHATGGSSGVRGVFVWEKEEFITFIMTFFRYLFRDEFSHWDVKMPMHVAVITADHPVHMSTPVFSVPLMPNMQMHLVYATLPMPTMIDMLNKLQPTHLIGYTSVIHDLAEQAQRGSLQINPVRVSVNSEPLFPQTRELFAKVWQPRITNMWGSTDCGPHAQTCDDNACLHLNEDVLIFEPVDANKQPVPVNHASQGVLITDLINKTMPLIRYEMDDQITVLDQKCQCGAHYRLIDQIKGRMDDDFIYPGKVIISTEVFESALFSAPAVVEYQIFQTADGADVDVVLTSPDAHFDSASVIAKIQEGYKKLGMENPKINLTIVEKLQRHAVTGKLRRYVPLK